MVRQKITAVDSSIFWLHFKPLLQRIFQQTALIPSKYYNTEL